MTVSPSPITSETVVLNPNYRLPGSLAISALPICFLSLWVGLPLILFALFLTIQTATLRLHFTATALDIYRGQTQIRHFPYQDWLHWEIFWLPVPILFYFREVNSIHFLPIIFDPAALRMALEQRCPRQTPL